jgi:hypothetical protein
MLKELEVAVHLQRVERFEAPYAETGWPLFAALPLLSARLPGRLRIVHLTRHPVPSALSHRAHNCYAGSPRDDAYTQMATLGPTDAGVFQSDYADRWERLTPYERCLFWWTEVHRFAIELPQRIPSIPFLRVKSEEILSGPADALAGLLDFIGLRWDDRWLERQTQRVDRWHHHSDEDVDPLQVQRHRLTVDVARELGYDPGRVDLQALSGRYRGKANPGLDRIGRFSR